ncbi:MAG: WYL domain-containing protein [Anaerolineales bacterium]|nr:WYL domain-containing protein [Anaerolineales bacterium]
MKTPPQVYPALHVIFTLLNAIRRGIPRQNIWREFRRQGIALKPRLAFWIPLCKQAGLIKELDDGLRITSYASSWLKKSSEEQTIDLVDAWQTAPINKKARQFRKKLLWKLKYNKPLTTKDCVALNGLDALGLTSYGELTRWGNFFIKGEGKLPTTLPPVACVVQDNQFIAHLPSHLNLLWQLEHYLRPSKPSVYPLTKRALHFYQGDPHELIALLEEGLKGEISARTKALILNQPSIRVADGIVLEFSSSAELAQLRRQPVLRKYFESFLSSRHVLIPNRYAQAVFELLKRRGVYVQKYEEQVSTKKVKRTHFSKNPLLQPVGRSLSKITLIEKYLQLGQALEMSYRAPGCAPENRRITPLSIEQRGEHTYVIAFCQTRRGQRTFRLDRMEVPGTW